MDFELLPPNVLSEALKTFFGILKKEKGNKAIIELADKMGMDYTRLTRAANFKKNPGQKFLKHSRAQLLESAITASGTEILPDYSEKGQKIFFLRNGKKINIDEEPDPIEVKINDVEQIYKIYYWRGGELKIGVGLMLVKFKQNIWSEVTLLIENHHAEHETTDAPYILSSVNTISEISGNIYIEFVDTTNSDLRQLAIFRTPKTIRLNRKIIEGVFATLTRNPYKPIAGVMLLVALNDKEEIKFKYHRNNDDDKKVENSLQYIDNLHEIPPVIQDFLYRKRLDTIKDDLISFKALPNYSAYSNLKGYQGVYIGHFVRSRVGVLEVFLLELYENCEAVIYFPGKDPGTIRDNPQGRFKWITNPAILMTASFHYDSIEDHWRFRFILDPERDNHSFLYGVFAGNEKTINWPLSGRVRLSLIDSGKNLEANDAPEANVTLWDMEGRAQAGLSSNGKRIKDIDKYVSLLRSVPLYSEDYWSLLEEDGNLRDFLSGHIKPTYTNQIKTRKENFHLPEDSRFKENDYNNFNFAGDYEVYTLYRKTIAGVQTYFIYKQPIRIFPDRKIQIKVSDNQIIHGDVTYVNPILKINFEQQVTSYTHLLLTVNQFKYQEIDHVFGVLSGVHVWTNRSEATIAVMLGPNSLAERKQIRDLNFEKNSFTQIEVGSKEFYELDSGDPAKLATFISGHNNRYISPPAKPNEPMMSRLSKYRLPYFKSACYSGKQYNEMVDSLDLSNVKNKNKIDRKKKECLNEIKEAFIHGFCDPRPKTLDDFVDPSNPRSDANLLVNELLESGTLRALVTDVLELCGKWNRKEVVRLYDKKHQGLKKSSNLDISSEF
ncbi:hypothetical protein [Dyadobacter diqingensis]|uniref:hypothetical protein n=1 Tax=Dyadobacter diqingensis TaxID=2938121 RepID=UPI0020C259BD|nr:hypothetical protein [Dyadobacter diqingensis]